MNDEQNQIEYLDIQITDFALHSNKLNNPKPWERTVQKSKRSNKPARLYTKILSVEENGTMVLEAPEGMVDKNGKRIVIRAHLPKGGVPIYAGSDLIEKVDAIKKKQNNIRVWKAD